MQIGVVLCSLVGLFSVRGENPHSCADIYKSNILQTSGVFTIYNRQQQPFQVYCDTRKGYGYTYISPNVTVDVNIDDLYTDTTHVVIRDLRKDGTQYESRIEQINAFKSTPLSIQYNSNNGYNEILNNKMTPYVYIGMIPKAAIRRGQIEGYKSNGKEFTFANCDGNGNSYFAFLFDQHGAGEVTHGPSPAINHQWFDTASSMSPSQNMPNYFYTSLEVHFGGCGAFGSLQHFPQLQGAAVGFRYDVTCPQPADVMHAQKNVSGLTAGSTVTYKCDIDLTMLSGSTTRTCAQTGQWTGVKPFCGKFPCESGPCQNGGSCFEVEGSQYVCECMIGFGGTYCERHQ